jgi:cyanophycinase
MKLAMVGSGEYLPGMDEVDRALLARLPGKPSVVCLPTAAGTEGEERIHYWSHLGIEHFQGLGAKVEALPVVDRASANDPTLAGKIAASNFVYFSGGNPNYLMDCLAGSLVWGAVQEVLAGGGLLAGCSAGAMIQGEKFYGFPGWKAGFALLPGATILPHYDEVPEFLVRVMRPFSPGDLVLIGVEGYTALLVDGGRYEVLGSGGVTIWTKNKKVRYTHGILPDWGEHD